ncbi:hypothetical protein PS1_045000 [Malus domestica]
MLQAVDYLGSYGDISSSDPNHLDPMDLPTITHLPLPIAPQLPLHVSPTFNPSHFLLSFFLCGSASSIATKKMAWMLRRKKRSKNVKDRKQTKALQGEA